MLAILLLFNMLGFYGLLMGLQYQNHLNLIYSLDQGSYDHSQTTLLKIPIIVPYAADQQEYQRVNGEFEHRGEFYKLVKQRLSQDTLYIICIRDHGSKKIDLALKDYARTFTDNPLHNKHHGKISVNFLKDYYLPGFAIKPVSDGWVLQVHTSSLDKPALISFISSIVHPPERISLV